MKNNEVELISYTKTQDALNCITHAVGVLAGVAVLIYGTMKAADIGSARMIASAVIYGLSLIVLYAASSVYHGLPMGEAKRTARLIDHSSIPILIAGTATPCAMVTLYNGNKLACAIVMVLGWGSVLFGIIAKLFFFQKTKAATVAVYIIAGAVMFATSLSVIEVINVHALKLLAVGCAVYIVGSLFCMAGRKHPSLHPIFHVFVLAGSMIHAWTICTYVLS